MIDDVATGDRNAVVHEQALDAGGRARARPGFAHHEPAEVDRVQAVDVLVGIDAQARARVVEPLRDRILHEVRVDVRDPR